jgi:hypothetical protein
MMAAQSTSGYGTTQSQGSSHKSMGAQTENKETLAGCLSKSGSDYFLTRSDGDRYQVTGDTSKLAAHVGHEIRVTGDVSEAGNSTDSTSGMGTKSEAGTIQMQSFQHVAAHCP